MLRESLNTQFSVLYHISISCFSGTFELRSFKFEGDKTGSLHVGDGQTVVVNHPDNMEFLVNIYVYEGGILILPPSFICYDVSFHIW